MQLSKPSRFIENIKAISYNKLVLVKNYITTQKWWVVAFFVILVLDAITTKIALANNLNESNPFWADGVLLSLSPWIGHIFRIFCGFAIVVVVGFMSNSKWFKWWFLQAYTVGYGIVPIWNMSNVIWVWIKGIEPKYREPFEFWQMFLLALSVFIFGLIMLCIYRIFDKKGIKAYL